MPKPLTKAEQAETGKYQTEIVKHLSQIGKSILAPMDKSNTGAIIAETFLWTEIEKWAKRRKEALWEGSMSEVITVPLDELDVGSHELTSTKMFIVTADVTRPVRRFNDDEAVRLLVTEEKMPEAKARSLVYRAKKEGKGTVTKRIVER